MYIRTPLHNSKPPQIQNPISQLKPQLQNALKFYGNQNDLNRFLSISEISIH